MLVFIRQDLLPHYQSYHKVINLFQGNIDQARRELEKSLPDYVTFDTLAFINEVKTTKPIPWIVGFDDVTSVKNEIQKKMLNELAELFLIKNKHFETVIDSFNKVMDSLSFKEQKNALQKINATKEIIDAVEKLEQYKNELEQSKKELDEAKKNNSIDKDKYEEKIKSLKNKIAELENETLSSSDSQLFIKNGQVQMGNPNFIGSTGSVFQSLGVSHYASGIAAHTTNASLSGRQCEKCGNPENLNTPYSTLGSYYDIQFHTCPSCNRLLCNSCWPHPNPLTSVVHSSIAPYNPNLCTDCAKK